MSSARKAVWRRRVVALAALLGVCSLEPRTIATSANAPEIRALWVLRTSLASPASIRALVKTASDHGFNTLLVQVRGRGEAYYTSDLEPRASELLRQPGTFDPLATVISEAHASGLRVHAWINLNLVSSAAELPLSRDHVIYRHPEWLMVPREIAQDLRKIDPVNPAYVGKIARWTRGEAEKVEGLYVSPLVREAAVYAQQVVTEVAKGYPVDGIHLDYVRYPSDLFDYSRYAIAEFRADIRPRLTPAVRTELDEQQAVDLFAYPDRFPAEWKTFRRAQLTHLLTRLRAAVKGARPDAMLTLAAAPDLKEAYDTRMQDWGTWLETHLIDAVCPMAYTQEPDRFLEQITAARDIAGGSAVWAGIGAYRLKPEQTIENIQAARRLGTAGFILFSYDSLTGSKQTPPDYLDVVSRGAFGASVVHTSGSR